MSNQTSRQVEIVEQILALLDHGSFTSTYKQAVLLAIIDVCKETVGAGGFAPQVVTTRQLALKVIELYWPQTKSWQGKQMLDQNSKGPGKIVDLVHKLRQNVSALKQPPLGFEQLAQAAPEHLHKTLDDVEWILIRYPLPKLQRLEGVVRPWIYSIAWDDKDKPARLGAVRAYQQDRAREFDNRIHLQPGVGACFVAMHSILRPLIMNHWAAKVATLNTLDVAYLHDFLFGFDRGSLQPLRKDLQSLQGGTCFYCREQLRSNSHIDHFIPWSRHPENGLHNLVLSHRSCNTSKSNLLAAVEHVTRWREWVDRRHSELEAIATARRWPTAGQRVLSIARAVYGTAPDGGLLWQARGSVIPADTQRAAIQKALM